MIAASFLCTVRIDDEGTGKSNRRRTLSSKDAMQPSVVCTSCGANTDSDCLLRAENNLLRTKFDILLDTVSMSLG